jgi:hypothetical protein
MVREFNLQSRQHIKHELQLCNIFQHPVVLFDDLICRGNLNGATFVVFINQAFEQ